MDATNPEEEQKARVHSAFLDAQKMATQGGGGGGGGGAAYDNEKHHDKGYSDLEVVEPPGLEVAGSDASQVVPSLYRPKFDEQRSFHEHSLPEVNNQQYGASYPPGVVPVSPPSATTATDYHYNNGGKNSFPPSAAPAGNGRILGLKKRLFWVLLAVVLSAIVLAIAVGLGVGLGIRTTDSAPSSANSTSTTSSPTSTASTTATGTSTLPAAVATGTLTNDTSIICPTANRTLYTDPSSSTGQKFLVLCGRDYNSAAGAVDMSSENITTFAKCVSECGNTIGCMAVGWGTYYGVNTCWLKSAIGDPNVSESWYSAVEDNDG